MKKTLRIIALFLVVALAVSILCSCNSLDELKNEHARWLNETHLELEYRGKKYVKYEDNSDIFSMVYFDSTLNIFPTKFLTEYDVPVLLGKYLGDSFDISRDEKIIRIWNKISDIDINIEMNESYDHEWYSYYILESEKDKIIEEYSNLADTANSYCYEYYDGDGMKAVLCPDEITEIINETLLYPETDEDETNARFDDCIEISKCNKNITISMRFGSIEKYVDGTYYLQKETSEYLDNMTYKFDSKYTKILDEFFDGYYSNIRE